MTTDKKRLIDADELKKKQTVLWDEALGFSDCVLVEDIDNAPTVDAMEVVRGRWIHCNGKSNLWYCSECGEKILYNPTRRTYNIEKRPVHEVHKHCRNCGATMDGDGNG